jgi:two-component system cell cycle sensor histidine kinase/response regulator CckA
MGRLRAAGSYQVENCMADKKGQDTKGSIKTNGSAEGSGQEAAVKPGNRAAGPVRAQTATKNVQAILRTLVDNMQQGVLFESGDRRILFANQSFCDLFGIVLPNAILGADCALLAEQARHAFTDPEGFIQTIERRLAERETVLSEELLLADGRIMERDYIPVAGGSEPSGSYWIYRDITDRKRADAALQEREKQLAESQRIAHIGSWEHNLKTGKVIWSDELFRLLGLDPRKDAADFKMFFDMIHPDDQPALKKAIDETVKTGRHYSVDYRFILRDGTTRILHAQAELIRDAAGDQVILSGTGQDITEHKTAEEELAISEGRYRSLFEDSPISLWEEDITDLQAHIMTLRACGITDFRKHFSNHPEEALTCLGLVKIVSVNKATLDMYEAPDQAALLQGLSQVFTAQSLEAFRGIIVALAEGAQIYECEAVNQTLRGRTINVLLRWSLLAGDRTKRSRALISIADITERKQAEEKVRQSEAKYRNLFESSTDGIFILDLDGNFIDVNTTAYSRLGYTKQEMLALHISKLDHPAFAPRVPERQAQIREHGISVFESAHLRKDGTAMPVEVNSRLIEYEGRTVFFSVIRDITARKKAESALKESERRLRTLIDAIPDAVVFKDTAGRHIIANKANEQLFGLSPEMLTGKMVEDLLPPDLAAICRRNDEEVLKKKETVRDEEHLTDKNGNKQILDTIRVPLYDDTGSAMGLVGIIRDITVRKQTEERVRQSEQFIRSILDTVDEGFIVIGRDYRILTANKAYCSQAGGCDEKVIGQHCYEISHNINRPCYEEGEECGTRKAFETGKPHSALHRHKDANGNILYVETKAFPIKDASGAVTSVIETINNITEKHLLEEERLKTQKLESIGTLAGGIAHDFNNLLQGIFGYISMAKMTIEQKGKSLAMLEQAEKALHQSVDLTTQLLTFSKGGTPVKKPIDLRPVIENSAKFTLSGSRSDFCMNIPEDLWQTEADAGQLGQVVQNIVLNADQAMPVGGTVVVTAANLAAGHAVLPPGLAKGDYVVIAIQDTGVGIPEQYLSKIFDPYFTTKEKGSGLGLATSYSIVRNHGGMIDIVTKTGEGSTFMIYLPAITGEGRTAAEVGVPEPSLPRPARVLVMDDEELIRNLSRDILSTLGHSVEVAKHGDEALEKYQDAMSAGKPFDIVILDVTVRGGMGGLKTMQKLVEMDSAVKAIVSSGYSDDAAIANHLSQGFKACLKKPYNIAQLRGVLSSLLS